MSQHIPYILGTVTICIVLLVIIRIWLKTIEEKTAISQELLDWVKETGRRVDTSTEAIDKKLAENLHMFNSRMDKTAHVIGDLQKEIGEFSEIGRSMKDLQEFLQSPKLRGTLGEQVLTQLIQQYFPHDAYAFQHTFTTGDKVDAVIKTSRGLIPIDSKFPAENYRKMTEAEQEEKRKEFRKLFIRDIRKHITDISRKYILPGEQTTDYALMYVPSESVFYEIINEPDLFDFASQKRILPVSPMSFYAYMKAILMSFEGEKIQKQAQQILQMMRSIDQDYRETKQTLNVLTKHVTNAHNQLSVFSRSFDSLGQKLAATHSLSAAQKKENLIE